MMKKNIFIWGILVLCLSFVHFKGSNAFQVSEKNSIGVKFKNISLSQAISRAAAENKLILIDFYGGG